MIARSGCTIVQQIAPTIANEAATAKDVFHPNRCAIHGVSEAVTAPPIWPPMLIMLENGPELIPAISIATDQKELCERYRAPAPPARINPAAAGLLAREPSRRNAAVRQSALDASQQRPARRLQRRDSQSLSTPPARQHTVMQRNGNIAYRALAFRFTART